MLPLPVLAQTFHVTDATDLTNAVTQINTTPGFNFIIFDNDITLNSSLSAIDGNVIIRGNGHTLTGTGSDRLFNVGGGASRVLFRMKDLTLKNGTGPGGGGLLVHSNADVLLKNVVLKNNTSNGDSGLLNGDAFGGAVFVEEGGSLTLQGNDKVNGNGLSGAGAGNGLFLQGYGNLTLSVNPGETLNIGDDISDATGAGVGSGEWNLIVSGGGGIWNDPGDHTQGKKYGEVRLGGDNKFSGDMLISGANVAVNNAGALGGGSNSVAVLDDGGLLLGAGLDLSRDLIVGSDGGRIGTLGTATLSSTLTGSGDMIKGGPGDLKLRGDSQFSGQWIVQQGALALDNDARLGSTDLVLAGGGIKFSQVFNDLRKFSLVSDGFVDNNGLNVTLSNAISGWNSNRLLTFKGSGTTTLTNGVAGAMSNGNTRVAAGKVVGGIAKGNLQVDASATYDLGGADRQVAALTGKGAVQLGSNDLTVNLGAGSLGGGLGGNQSVTEFAGRLEGGGQLIVNNGALLPTPNIDDFSVFYLSGTNSSWTGGTLVKSGAIVDVRQDASLGAGGLTLQGGGFSTHASSTSIDTELDGKGYLLTDGSTLDFDGLIHGNGDLVKAGAGTLFLNNNNTYHGNTTVTGADSYIAINHLGALGDGSGSLQLTQGGGLKVLIDITGTNSLIPVKILNGVGVIDVNGNHVKAGDITGTALSSQLTKAGSGTLLSTGSVNLLSGINIAGGTLQIGDYDSGLAGTGLSGSLKGNVTMAAGTELVFDRRDAMTVNSNISGAGQVVQAGLGTTELTGINTQAGGTLVTNGRVAVSDDNSLGAAGVSLRLRDGGLLQYLADFSLRDIELQGTGGGLDTHGQNIDYTGLITGQGDFLKAGAGKLTVTNLQTAGGLHVMGGELQMGDGADATSLLVLADAAIDSGATLSLYRAGQVTLGGTLSGSGDFRQKGEGELYLPGDSSAFSGTTWLEDGSLRLDGKLGGDLEIKTDTLLQGVGTLLGNLNVTSGHFAPGNSIGTFHVGKDLTLDSASVTEIETDDSGNSDKIIVGGKASLSGTLAVTPQPGDYSQSGCCSYVILTANDGVNGSFDSIDNGFAFLKTTVDYQPNQVTLYFNRNNTAFSGIELTWNQRQVAEALDKMGTANPADPVVSLVTPLTAAQARDAYDALGGDSLLAQTRVAVATARRFGQVLSAHGTRMGMASRGGVDLDQALTAVDRGKQPDAPQRPDYQGPTAPVEGGWVQLFGVRMTQDADSHPGSPASHMNGSLLALGADGYWTDRTLVGVGLGAAQGNLDVDNRHSDGDVTGYYAGVYAKHQSDTGRQLKGSVSVGRQNTSQTRHIDIGSNHYRQKASGSTTTLNLEGELGWAQQAGRFSVRPYLLANMQWLKRDGMEESGTAPVALSVDAATIKQGAAGAGIELSRPWQTSGAHWAQWRAGIAVLQPFGDTQHELVAHFASGPDFTVKSTANDKPVARVTLGAEWYMTSHLALWGGYEGRFSKAFQMQNGLIGLQYRW